VIVGRGRGDGAEPGFGGLNIIRLEMLVAVSVAPATEAITVTSSPSASFAAEQPVS
jgi:hypothetical protein